MTVRLRNESGQAVLMTVLFLSVLMGVAALSVDVGSWYRQQRQAQATADAAALAGAQALPADPTQAQVLAAQYATSNGGGVLAAGGITLRDDFGPHDTVVVKVSKDAPSFFANVFAIDRATVTATAAARAGVPEQVNGAAPIVVNKLHPLLSGPGCPCFDTPTTLPLGKDGAPGAFGLVDLNGGRNGNPDLVDWITSGYDGYLGLGSYDSDTGVKFGSDDIEAALSDRLGTELLFPVYDTLKDTGSNAQYDVIGWVAFHLTSFDAHGNDGDLSGWFTKVIWAGLQSSTNKHLPDFGVYSVELVN
ncbi:MAG: pilus assembly protein TadG-related protein [Gaiellaceae bacterium]